MIFWLWAFLLVAGVLGFVALLFGPTWRTAGEGAGAAGAGGRAPRRWPLYAGAGLLLLLLAGVAGWTIRAPAPAAAPTTAAAEAADPRAGEVADLLAQLEARMEKTPNEPEGWRMLGWARFQSGDFAGAVTAYRRAQALVPDDGETASALGEAMVMAAGGRIAPEAEAQFARALERLPGDPRARYYLAAAKDQAGDTRAAIDAWIALIRDSPPDAPVTLELRNLVAQRARAAGIDISGRLPEGGRPPRVPDAAQVAEAEGMAPSDRQAMIRAMVDGLDARLAEQPADPEGWQRLIRARMVLGERDKAQAALQRAEQALAADPNGLAAVRAEARASGLAG